MEWTVVGRKGKKSGRPCKQEHHEGQQEAQPHVADIRLPVQRRYKERTATEKVQDLSSQLQRIKAEVADSDFYENFLPKLNHAEQLWEEHALERCADLSACAAPNVSAAPELAAHRNGTPVSEMQMLSAQLQTSLTLGQHQQAAASSQIMNGEDKDSRTGVLRAPNGAHRLWRWDEVEEMVVYGLGSLEAGHVPRYQLALALLLADRLPKLQGPIQVFDPVFTEVDHQLLKEQGLLVLGENEEGRRRATRPTLFYLPHCEADLCSNLVEANLGCGTLAVVLGNSFALYHERWTQAGSAQTQHRRARLDALLRTVEVGAVLEVPISDHHFPVVSAFNDMSLHLFPATGNPANGDVNAT